MERKLYVTYFPRLPASKPSKAFKLHNPVTTSRTSRAVSVKVLEVFSTSLCLTAVTNLSPSEVLMVVIPTNRLLSCGNLHNFLLDAFDLIVLISMLLNFVFF
ncbi:predicted protein [Arabidopsis lyrata subsp. lyrata]|uniref:Predicted protein n=1 Tax=Arabidopsis lyrata subsp. lyrata TaxID=81972 RepID=D7MTI1_ARALL|nr:predicted protein [Arabidopsis lyrata subsp. lyrata]